MKIFLGGTCNGSKWREKFIPCLPDSIGYFNPVVDDWNEEARLQELHERQNCDFCLYTITPKMTGVYAIAEAVDDSNKRPEKTMFCILDTDETATFSEPQLKSLASVKALILRNGGACFHALEDVAIYAHDMTRKR